MTIEIEISQINNVWNFPVHLKNWTNEHHMRGVPWETARKTFSKTTNGYMYGIKGETKFTLMFDNEIDYVTYLLRYS